MSERNNSNKKDTKGNLHCTDVPFSTFAKNQLHKIVTLNLWVFLQVPSSQKKQRYQTIEFSWGLYCLVVLFLLLL